MRTASHLPATGWMFTTLTVGALVWTLVCPAQCSAQQQLPGYMCVKKGWFTDGSKVVLDGQTYRPARAADLCDACWEARDRFEHARRLLVRSFILANLGLGICRRRAPSRRRPGRGHGPCRSWGAVHDVGR